MKSISISDDQLVSMYSGGDQNALGALYKRYAHHILGIALYYLKNTQDAEDATMEIFVRVSKKLLEKEVLNFKPWISKVTRNYCLNYLRDHKQFLSEEFIVDIFMENEPSMVLEDELKLDHLSRALFKLNEDQRKCIELFYYQQNSYKEIEQRTGYSLNQIKSFIQNGKRNLKKLLIKNSTT